MFATAAVLTVVLFSAPGDEDVRDALRRVYESEPIRKNWPDEVSEDPEEPVEDAGRGLGHSPGAPPAAEATARALLWVVVGVCAALLLAWLARAARARAPPAPAPAAVLPLPRRDAGPAPSPAEALAAEGRWREAVHALLLEALAAVRGPAADAALTSREVVARATVPDAARRALAGIVHTVEVCLFGGADATEADWKTCAAWRDEIRNARPEPA